MKKILSVFPSLFCILYLLIILSASAYSQDKITLLSFNVWLGGTSVDDGKNKVLNAIKKSGADIIGLCEATDSIGKFVADKLGWYSYLAEDNNIISRYPIIKTWSSLKGACAEIEINNGRTIVVEAVHLYYTPYGPYRACHDSASVHEILKEETTSGRMGEIEDAIKVIENYIQNGTPVFLLGDFNVPSHLDWTEQTKDRHCGYIIEWPVTKAVENAGMKDSYREIYPDPAAFPGVTWSPVYKTFKHENGKSEPMDRIDFIFYSGTGVKALSSEFFIIGIPEQIPDHKLNEWPSDHAAVISTFTVSPDTIKN